VSTGARAVAAAPDAGALAAAVRRGEVSAEACARAALERARECASLNAIAWLDEARVLAQAREVDARRARGERLGPLAGVPFVVKDNIDVAGAPTTAGTPALRDDVAETNAPVVQRLLDADAVFLAKAAMHELAAGPTSNNVATGPVRNPYAPDRVAGGSSGGTACAIAAGIVPAGLGTDTAGSVRIPSAFCGTAGLRPTTLESGRYPDAGIVPVSSDLDTVGPMARTVADVALLHSVITGTIAAGARDPDLRAIRMGVPRRYYWEDVDAGVLHVAEDALVRLRDAGATLVDVDTNRYRPLANEIYSTLLMHGAAEGLPRWLAARGRDMTMERLLAEVANRDARFLYERALAQPVPEAKVAKARGAVRARIVAAYRELFRTTGIAALVFPTVPVVAPPVRADGDHPLDVLEVAGEPRNALLTLIRNTHVTAPLGAPGLSFCAGFTDEGLPVGLELDALPGEDDALLALGIAVERVIRAP
jgi:mandelamide amidase